MEVILLKDISGVGQKYEVKEVSPGYAQNFLFPRKLALKATVAEVKKIESQKIKADEQRKIGESLLEKNIESLANVKVVIKTKASEKGHLFASIHKDAVIVALHEQARIEISPEYLDMPQNIKSTGVFKILVQFKKKKSEFELEVVEV